MLILNVSPHNKGISDSITQEFVQYFPLATVYIARNHVMEPCNHCNHCEEYYANNKIIEEYSYASCPLAKESDTILFNTLLQENTILFVSPIYFYHIPALAKSIIDRSQAVYAMNITANPSRVLYPVLHAGREKGKRLFEGSLLTLSYFAKALGMDMATPLLLRNTDALEESSNVYYAKEIKGYANSIGQSSYNSV